MLAPFLLVFTLFMLIPVIAAVFISFTDYNMLQTPDWVGFSNYARLFLEDTIFTKAAQNTFLFALITGPIGYLLCFLVAWFINELGRRLRSIIMLIMYAPTLAGNIYYIWTYIFSGDSRGLMNNSLMQLGIIQDPIYWLTDPKY